MKEKIFEICHILNDVPWKFPNRPLSWFNCFTWNSLLLVTSDRYKAEYCAINNFLTSNTLNFRLFCTSPSHTQMKVWSWRERALTLSYYDICILMHRYLCELAEIRQLSLILSRHPPVLFMITVAEKWLFSSPTITSTIIWYVSVT